MTLPSEFELETLEILTGSALESSDEDDEDEDRSSFAR
eukprot:CAMPEP_0170509126 /NCGR_PEP_ID=MMETSP0208-20121228/64438_1 /TAXON_ID=197538 /ORGANISM="Strombidium inclinatum, Strain S3" /LENGTH=37 /DNA_ID= /DNA_START= /DNA_END= /DNA_ORIENTATION=